MSQSSVSEVMGDLPRAKWQVQTRACPAPGPLPPSTLELGANLASFLSRVSANVLSKTATTKQTRSLDNGICKRPASVQCISLSRSALQADGARWGCDCSAMSRCPVRVSGREPGLAAWQVLHTCTGRAFMHVARTRQELHGSCSHDTPLIWCPDL